MNRSTPHQISLLILALDFFVTSSAFGQVQVRYQNMGYIHVNGDTSCSARRYPPDERDLIRHRFLLRLDLQYPYNRPLFFLPVAPPYQGVAPGLIGVLLNGFAEHQFSGLDPMNPEEQMTYEDFLYRFAEWQGLSHMNQNSISIAELGLEHFEPIIDLIVDEGFSTRSSKYFFSIRFVRLIWRHAQFDNKSYVALYVPYQCVRPLLENHFCWKTAGGGISAAQFLELGYFSGLPLMLPSGPSEAIELFPLRKP